MLVVALTTLAATALLSRQYMDIRRTSNIMLFDQAFLYAQGMENVVGRLLQEARESGQQRFDDRAQFDEVLAQMSLGFSFEGGNVTVSADYVEGRFNVNSLVDEKGDVVEKHKESYKALLNAVAITLEIPQDHVNVLVDSLVDWMDKNSERGPEGAEDETYESKEIPYKAANRHLLSISELRLIEGYTEFEQLLEGIPPESEDEEPIKGLLAYVSAVPIKDSKLNVNLVTEPLVFSSLSYTVDAKWVDQLMVIDEPYETVSAFVASNVFDQISGSNENPVSGDRKKFNEDIGNGQSLSVQSNYFQIRIVSNFDRVSVNLNSLLYVDKAGTKFEVLSRAIGTDGI